MELELETRVVTSWEKVSESVLVKTKVLLVLVGGWAMTFARVELVFDDTSAILNVLVYRFRLTLEYHHVNLALQNLGT